MTPRPSLLAHLLLSLVSSLVALRADEPLPAVASILENFETQLAALDDAFDRETNKLREGYANELREIKNTSIERGLWTRGIWAHRNLRVLDDPNTEWLALLAPPHIPPDSLAQLNEDVRLRLEDLRERALQRAERLYEATGERLRELEEDFVGAWQTDHAVSARAARDELEDHEAYRNITPRLQTHTPENARERAAKTNQRSPEDEEALPAPPDAWFPFQRENPVLQAFNRRVRARSAGYHAGPAASILLGERLHHHGTRGLALLALVDREVVLRETYDTYAFSSESERLIEDIGELPYGALVVIAVRDDATRRFSGAAQSALARLGAAHGIQPLPYRSSYLMIGLKGLAPGHALEKHGMQAVELNPSSPE